MCWCLHCKIPILPFVVNTWERQFETMQISCFSSNFHPQTWASINDPLCNNHCGICLMMIFSFLFAVIGINWNSSVSKSCRSAPFKYIWRTFLCSVGHNLRLSLALTAQGWPLRALQLAGVPFWQATPFWHHKMFCDSCIFPAPDGEPNTSSERLVLLLVNGI